MSLKTFIFLGASLLATLSADAALLNHGPHTNSINVQIADRYVVKLKQGVKATDFISRSGASFAGGSTNIQHTYKMNAFQGFAGRLSPEAVEKLKNDPSIEYVQPQQIVRIAEFQKNPPSWGLTRVSQRRLDLDRPYEYPNSIGSGVDAWIIDTGIQSNHSDFEGRASMVKNYVKGEDQSDMNGHGTHVAGTIGSKSYGIAKGVKLYGIKVLNGDGQGMDADVIAAIQYVTEKARPGKSVINMSLGGGKSTALNDAVDAAVSAGLAFIVAAGNEASDACQGSPSGAPSAFAVGASDKTDKAASFSNYGNCVKVYAPGVDIVSLWKGHDGETKTISGTSMASPHVAGIAALYLSSGNYSQTKDLYKALQDYATKNIISGAPRNTINSLSYSLLKEGGGSGDGGHDGDHDGSHDGGHDGDHDGGHDGGNDGGDDGGDDGWSRKVTAKTGRQNIKHKAVNQQ